MSHPTKPPRFPQFQVFVRVGDETLVFRLPIEGVVSVGRAPENDIVIDAAFVSPRHATLTATANRILVEHVAGEHECLLVRRDVTPRDARPPFESLPSGRPLPFEVGDRLMIGAAVLSLDADPHGELAAPSSRPQPPAVIVDAAMVTVYDLVKRAAATDLPVLILGEMGVGKNVVAQVVHDSSPRSHRQFTVLSCAALAENVLDVELEGLDKAAPGGAALVEQGMLQASAGGTVMLDEVGELTLSAQGKLLSIIEHLQQPHGRPMLPPSKVAVRFVSTTTRDLLHDVRQGTFRRDLYFRISGVVVQVPPLRERPVEIAPLAREFVRQFCVSLGQPEPELGPGTMEELERYQWPGNVRELKNVVERAVVLAGPGPVVPAHVQLDAERLAAPRDPAGPSPAGRQSLERARIMDALAQCGGNQTRAALLLGISRRALVNRLDRLQVPRPKKE